MKSTTTWGAFGVSVRHSSHTRTTGRHWMACDRVVEKFPFTPSRPGHTKIGSYAEVMGENTARCRRLGVSLEPARAACYANRVGWERSPLSDDTVRAIRAAKGTEREIAQEVGVSVHSIGGVRRRDTYAKVV